MKTSKKIAWSTAILSCALTFGVAITTAAPSVAATPGRQSISNSGKTETKKERLARANPEMKPSRKSRARAARVVSVSKRDFDKQVLKSPVLVLVDFYADWCGPCRLQSQILDESAGQLDDGRIVKVNVDENGELASAYGATSIPALLLFEKGKLVIRHVGLASKQQIKAALEK